VLEVEDLCAGYGDVPILRDVSLSCPSGCVVALLGPNAAGKTTLLKSIAGLLTPSSGHIRLEGRDITGHPTHRVARLGLSLVPEGRGIFPSLTVRENLRLFAGQVTDNPATVEELSMIFPALASRMSQVAGSLSGGEQQMLAMIRAHSSKPKLVLLDEVSMGLAPLIVDSLFEMIARMAASGTTILIVEQYVSRALDLADTAYLIDRGRIVFHGPTNSLNSTDIYEKYLGLAV
jgi:branched-chain amino acid transport system ATP-binding protein